ncbi:tripartite tricarboxylate transporter substrate binding protein [Variovorax sp. J22G21]|uniref:Bug family tripartite tricarboxylate transporter substrate binding protein n=1 Tax=Variovorax fucosicus TaxID=3053517 RepID=UPI002574CA3D|nr:MULTISPECIES: tripartite tricarboxylate transporter substrate binding protein [unclassified Variovorax]MDM0041374.1 tripartite tricarboxylate transporter substrate binding protein [Variovorax sp. J22R193]MDM0060430.1 tripartite tricarboxylate transporter substrate binding protein [Variovorax sp. J22G21]
MQHIPFKALRRTLFAGSLVFIAGLASAAGYPERPLVLVAPFSAGGAADVLARILAKKLEEQLGQPVVVENKPGAGTAIGAAAVANAKPDGYTLLISSNSTFTLNPALQSKLSYDPAKGFDAIGMVGSVALAVLVNPSVAANGVKELVAAAKASPDKYVYGSFGNGTSSNFAGAMFNASTGLSMTHIPYKGSAPLMTDLIGGQIPVSFDTVVAAGPQRKNGKVKVLAVTTAKRSALMPDVPTVAESGYPGYELNAWIALVAPRGLPADVKARLEKALATTMATADTQDRMKNAGFEPGYQAIPDWAGMVTADTARMRKIAEQSQIKAE